MNRYLVIRLLSLAMLFVATLTSPPANAGRHPEKRSAQLFIFDPSGTGTVGASYVNKFKRFSALLIQSHTFEDTACGYLFNGLQGLPIGNITCGVDFSNDTNVSSKADLILIGISSHGIVKHMALGTNPTASFPSGPGWTSYRYDASKFSPPIASNEVLRSFSLSLLGGSGPDTHKKHWASRPMINGALLREDIEHTADLSNTNGFNVLP